MSKDAFALDAYAAGAASALKAAWWTASGFLARMRVRAGEPDFKPATPPPNRRRLRQAWAEAFVKDLADVRAGLYPPEAGVYRDPAEALKAVGDFLDDAVEVEARRRRKGGVEARKTALSAAYPIYYRQNFHYQTGGWFTPESARRYEAQVEALFSGAAGAMRRRGLSLLARRWRGLDQRALSVVDVACGAGAFLADLKRAFPRARVAGVDLSPTYTVQAARVSGAGVAQADATRTPFADGALDAVTSVYLFHELPPKIRPRVAAEMARIVRPGGVVVLADSVQTADEPELARLLEAFPAFFHEPYYDSYQATDLVALFEGVGLKLVETDQAFLTKAWMFEKPLPTRRQNSAS